METRISEIPRKVLGKARGAVRKLGKRLETPSMRIRTFRKRYFADIPLDLKSIGVFRREFLPATGPSAWLDQPNALELIEARLDAGQITAHEAELCRQWVDVGYVVIPKMFSDKFLDEIWAGYEEAVADGRIPLQPEKASEDDPFPGRFLNPHLCLPQLQNLHAHPSLTNLVTLFFGRPAIAYQTISSHKGSQQGVHSDAIHMTSYPLGYLNAAWVAFEDIHADSGPLVFYPGSHRLPYLLSKEAGIAYDAFAKSGYEEYAAKYEPAIRKLIEESGIQPKYFLANKGDVLIWHANLAHGGSLRRNMQLSRKAIVCHYFAQGALCYHDLSGGMADLNQASRYPQ